MSGSGCQQLSLLTGEERTNRRVEEITAFKKVEFDDKHVQGNFPAQLLDKFTSSGCRTTLTKALISDCKNMLGPTIHLPVAIRSSTIITV